MYMQTVKHGPNSRDLGHEGFKLTLAQCQSCFQGWKSRILVDIHPFLGGTCLTCGGKIALVSLTMHSLNSSSVCFGLHMSIFGCIWSSMFMSCPSHSP